MTVRAAVLDIGTNTVRLLAADLDGEALAPVLDRTDMTRLGQGARADGTLAPEPVERTARAVAAFVREAREVGAQLIFAVGTAAVRDAPNRDILLERIER